MSITIEMEIDFGIGFVDVLADLRQRPEPEWEFGIRGSGPLDRTATPGMLRFHLDNSTSNSGGVLGYYSPGNPNVREGFTLNARARLTIDGIVQFYGWIASITPLPGKYGQRDTEVLAVDYIGKLMNEPITGLAVMTSVTADDVITEILDAMTIQPSGRSLDVGSDTYPYALDTSREEESNALSEIAKVVQSEGGFAWSKRDGTFLFANRASRSNPVPLVSFTEDTIKGMEIAYPDEAIRNRVRVKVYPRSVDGSAVVLFSQPSTITPALVAGGAAIVVQCPYTDPANRSSRVGGTDMVSPVATTDYLANSLANGTGTNLTASLTVTPTFGGDAAQLSISLGGGTSGFLTKLQVRGKGIYPYATQTVEESDATSITAYGVKSLGVDMPYQSDINVGVTAAQAYLGAFKDPGPSILTLSFWDLNTTLREYALNSLGESDINSTLTLSESVTGGDVVTTYWLNGIRMRLVMGQHIFSTWYLGRADTTPYWVLDDASFTLGDNTRLAPF